MSRIRFALAALAAAALTVVGTASAAPVKLSATVGPGFTISLKKGSKKVAKIKAGTYLIIVSDKSNIHNFHLTGPGLNKKTGIAFTGETTWKIKLKPGRYTYQCDPHAASGMKGHFKVTK